MKAMIHIQALGLTLDADTVSIDPSYERRCITNDAERAWKMRDPLEKALSWPKGTRQYNWWMAAYNAAREAS